MNYSVEVITKDKMKTSMWSGGKTNEIYIYPKKADYKSMNFSFRVSSATVDIEHSVFTNLPGVLRYITTLDGDMDIVHDGKERITLRPYEVHKFLGDSHTESYGKVQDFNLMLMGECNGNLRALDVSHDRKVVQREGEYKSVVIFSKDIELSVYIDVQKIKLHPFEAVVILGTNYDDLPEVSVSSCTEGKALVAEIK